MKSFNISSVIRWALNACEKLGGVSENSQGGCCCEKLFTQGYYLTSSICGVCVY